jgi:hypothetical protein
MLDPTKCFSDRALQAAIRRLPRFAAGPLISVATSLPGLRNARIPDGHYVDLAEMMTATDAAGFLKRFRKHDAHPAESLIRNPPVHLEAELHERFICELKKESPSTFVLEYEHGRCWGTQGTVVTPDNRVLAEMSHEFCPSIQQYRIFQQTVLDQPRHLKGTAILLAAPAGQVYAHFLLDVLPGLAILERAGFNWKSADHYIISGPQEGFQGETLRLLGIEPERIVDASTHPHLTADQLLIPSRPGISGNYPRWAVEFVRELLLPLATKRPDELGPRLFISRSLAKMRRIRNESEIFRVLDEKGFCLVHNEKLSVAQQLATYVSAECVIGPMGSSTCNTLFCQPDTTVIESYSDSSVNVFTWAFGQHVPLKFGYLVGKGIDDKCQHPHDWDYTVDVDQLQQLIDRMGAQ